MSTPREVVGNIDGLNSTVIRKIVYTIYMAEKLTLSSLRLKIAESTNFQVDNSFFSIVLTQLGFK
jgi:hypothetical protein